MAPQQNAQRAIPKRTSLKIAVGAAAVMALAAPLGAVSAQAETPAFPISTVSSPHVAAVSVPQSEKPRMILTQDGEVDDMDSFIRWLYYANEFYTAGIIYSSSTYHYSGNGTDVAPFRWTGTTWVNEYIDRYAAIYPNLIKHADGYPTPAELKALYKIGNITNVSEMTQVTQGSEWIKNVILDDDTRPLYIQAWGGLNTVARALKSIEEEYSSTEQWAAIQAKVNAKVIVYNILNQDSTLNGYIKPSWPGVKIIDNQSAFWAFAYQWTSRVPAPSQYVLRAPWMEQHMLDETGTLMNQYRTYRDGLPTAGDDQNNRWRPENTQANQNLNYGVHDFISEGDSPAYMYLLDFNGLRSSENPTWGGWGGRFAPNATGWVDTADENPYSTSNNNRRSYPLTRWVEDIQLDFAARIQWGMESDYDDANHNPVSSVEQGLDLNRVPGSVVHLNVASSDPDGDSLTNKWWQYTDADTYPGTVTIEGASTSAATFTVPSDAVAGQTIHLIVETKDDGSPSLKHYQRVVVTVVDGYSETLTEQAAPSASTAGTTDVTLNGTDLVGITGVDVGGTLVDNFTVSPLGDSISFRAPASEISGPVAVSLTTVSAESLTGSIAYVGPTITGISPARGPIAGGSAISITGTGLSTAVGAQLGGTDVSSLTVSGSTVNVVTPAHAAGTSTVTVVLPGKDAVVASGFVYVDPAVVTTASLSAVTQRFGTSNPVRIGVSARDSAGSPLAGTVSIFDGPTLIAGPMAVDAAGNATAPLSGNLAVGTHAVSARFTPSSAEYATSASAALTLTVTKATASVKGKLADSSISKSEKGKLAITVKVTGAVPSGKVTVFDGKKSIKTATVASSGKLTVVLPKLAKGKHSISVVFAGSATVSSDTSPKYTLSVK